MLGTFCADFRCIGLDKSPIFNIKSSKIQLKSVKYLSKSCKMERCLK